jgi:hypothetical protein
VPLSKGTSPKAFSKNVKTEMEHGKPNQAVAIAYAAKRKAQHKAHGGEMDACPECGAEGYAHGGEVEFDNEGTEGLELDDEPMGNSWGSDEFLAHSHGEMTSNNHAEFEEEIGEPFSPETEEPEEKKLLSKIMDGMRLKGMRK